MKINRMDREPIQILKDLAASNRAIAEAVTKVLDSPIVIKGYDLFPETRAFDGNTVILAPNED